MILTSLRSAVHTCRWGRGYFRRGGEWLVVEGNIQHLQRYRILSRKYVMVAGRYCTAMILLITNSHSKFFNRLIYYIIFLLSLDSICQLKWFNEKIKIVFVLLFFVEIWLFYQQHTCFFRLWIRWTTSTLALMTS